jgi:hypothetical protein
LTDTLFDNEENYDHDDDLDASDDDDDDDDDSVIGIENGVLSFWCLQETKHL